MKNLLLGLLTIIFISCGESNSTSSSVNGESAGTQFSGLATAQEEQIVFSDNFARQIFEMEILKSKKFKLFSRDEYYTSKPFISGRWFVKNNYIVFKNMGRADYYDLNDNGTPYKCIRFIKSSLSPKIKNKLNQLRRRDSSLSNLSFCRRK